MKFLTALGRHDVGDARDDVGAVVLWGDVPAVRGAGKVARGCGGRCVGEVECPDACRGEGWPFHQVRAQELASWQFVALEEVSGPEGYVV